MLYIMQTKAHCSADGNHVADTHGLSSHHDSIKLEGYRYIHDIRVHIYALEIVFWQFLFHKYYTIVWRRFKL